MVEAAAADAALANAKLACFWEQRGGGAEYSKVGIHKGGYTRERGGGILKGSERGGGRGELDQGGHLLFFQLVKVFQGGDDGGGEQGDNERDGGERLSETHTMCQHTAAP